MSLLVLLRVVDLLSVWLCGLWIWGGRIRIVI